MPGYYVALDQELCSFFLKQKNIEERLGLWVKSPVAWASYPLMSLPRVSIFTSPSKITQLLNYLDMIVAISTLVFLNYKQRFSLPVLLAPLQS
jgi:hypothetical protein